MSKIYNRWGILLALVTVCVIAALLSFGVYADDYGVWVEGIQITDLNKADVLGDGTVVFTPASGTDPAKLSLNGADIYTTTTGKYANSYGIYSEIGLVIDLSGDNKVSSYVENHQSYGIRVGGDLTITGSGKLSASGGGSFVSGDYSCGIRVYGKFVQESGEVEADGGVYDPASGADPGHGLITGYIEVKGGSLTGKCYFNALTSNGSSAISGGKVTAVSENGTGIKVFGSLGISGSAEVKATGGGEYGAIYTASGITFADTHEITDPAYAVVDGKVIKSGGAAATHVVIMPKATVTVIFDTDGGSLVPSQTVISGGCAVKPTDKPIKEKCEFWNWYADPGRTTLFDFSQPILSDTTIYAKWVLVSDSFTLEGWYAEDNSDGTYTLNASKMEAGFVEGSTPLSYSVSPLSDNKTEFTGVVLSEGPVSGVAYYFKVQIEDTVGIEGNTEVFFSYDIPSNLTIDVEGADVQYAKMSHSPGGKYLSIIFSYAETKYTVDFDTDGGSAVEDQTVRSGECAAKPTDPTKEGYVFGGWYKDSSLTTEFDFSQPITSDTTVYAKWDKDSGADPVIPPYFPAFPVYPVYPVYPLPVIWPQPPVQTTPASPAAPAAPSAPAPVAAPAPASAPAPAPETDGLPFTDVPGNTDMYDIVKYVYDGDIMQGVSDTEFNPYGELTRGMIVTILYRIEGRPAVDYSGAFEDVPIDAWFTAGVEWAAQSGIVLGYGDGIFAPDESVTREQLAAILYRYAGWKGCDVETADVAAADAGDISDWAAGAVGWAAGNGVLTASEGELRPTDNALRWEVAAAVRALLEIAAK